MDLSNVNANNVSKQHSEKMNGKHQRIEFQFPVMLLIVEHCDDPMFSVKVKYVLHTS